MSTPKKAQTEIIEIYKRNFGGLFIWRFAHFRADLLSIIARAPINGHAFLPIIQSILVQIRFFYKAALKRLRAFD